jgi:hypothetical protein
MTIKAIYTKKLTGPAPDARPQKHQASAQQNNAQQKKQRVEPRQNPAQKTQPGPEM